MRVVWSFVLDAFNLKIFEIMYSKILFHAISIYFLRLGFADVYIQFPCVVCS